MDALSCLHETLSKAYRVSRCCDARLVDSELCCVQVNPQIRFEVFIHKVDGLSDDHKIETQRDISQRANEELHEAGLNELHLR